MQVLSAPVFHNFRSLLTDGVDSVAFPRDLGTKRFERKARVVRELCVNECCRRFGVPVTLIYISNCFSHSLEFFHLGQGVMPELRRR